MRARPAISALCAFGLVAGGAASALGAAGDVITTYGTGGTVAATGFSGYQAMGSELDSQGRLLMASGSSQGLAVNRISAAGVVDSGFGSSGTALASVDPSYASSDVIAVDSQDRAVLASYTFNGSSGEFEGYAQRFDANGDPDATFGSGGLASVPELPFVEGVDIDASDRVLLAGYGVDGFDVARLTDTGAADASFGGDGVVSATFAGNERAHAVIAAPGGKVLAGGTGGGGIVGPLALARFNADGTPDTTFSGDGQLTLDTPGWFGTVQALTIDPLGRIVAAGWLSTCQTKDTCPTYTMVWAVARFTKKGKPDPTFGGGDGLVTLKPSRTAKTRQYAYGVAVDSHGSIYVDGTTFGVSVPVFAMLHNDGSPAAGTRGMVQGTDGGSSHSVVVDGNRILWSGHDNSGTPWTQARKPVPAPKPVAKVAKPKGAVKQLKGTAGPSYAGVGKVRVALWLHDAKLERKGKCRWLSGPGPSFVTEPMQFGACAPHWLKPKGTATWTYALKKALGKGTYTAYAETTLLYGDTKTGRRGFTVR
jgi:uncharacterized delta-60 repeat protein